MLVHLARISTWHGPLGNTWMFFNWKHFRMLVKSKYWINHQMYVLCCWWDLVAISAVFLTCISCVCCPPLRAHPSRRFSNVRVGSSLSLVSSHVTSTAFNKMWLLVYLIVIASWAGGFLFFFLGGGTCFWDMWYYLGAWQLRGEPDLDKSRPLMPSCCIHKHLQLSVKLCEGLSITCRFSLVPNPSQIADSSIWGRGFVVVFLNMSRRDSLLLVFVTFVVKEMHLLVIRMATSY